jgi:hypothetical protein
MLHIGIAVAFGVGALCWLSSEKQRQHRAYQSERVQLQHTRQRSSADITRCIAQANAYRDYQGKIQLHHAAMQTANQAYQLYATGKQLRDHTRAQLQQAGQQIGLLKAQRQAAMGAARDALSESLRKQREIHHALKTLLHDQCQQLEQDYEQLKQFNQQTAELKENIRDHSGDLGRRWFERMQERRLARALEG